MNEINTILNTCYELTLDTRVIAGYSHIIPVLLSLTLSFFVFFKAKFNLFSKIFLAFTVSFSLWLLGDLITWGSNNYNLIYFIWSTLVYIELIFFILGLYFVIVFVHERDAKWYTKLLFLAILLIPFIMTVNGQSVTGFNQSVCEAGNNSWLDTYKLIVEGVIVSAIVFYLIRSFFKFQDYASRKADIIVISSILLFLTVFGATEYISSITGVYEYNLYSLFILPIFLITIIYAVFELDIFRFDILGTQYLVVGLVILSGGQLFFISSASDRFLTILSVALTLGLSVIIFRNFKKETDQRLHIEKLSVDLADSKLRLESTNMKLEAANDKLKELDKLKTEFLSLATHQIRSPLTAIKGYASMVVDGDFGPIGDQAKEAIDRIYQSSKNLAIVVEDFLNVSKIESGGMKYEKVNFDFAEISKSVATDLSLAADKKGIKLEYTQDEGNHMVKGDKEKLRQVVLNLIDNSIKYTKAGNIWVSVKQVGDKMLFAVKDTGIGMTEEIKNSLFQKFSRGNGGRYNTTGSGLGLYLGKEITAAHGGRIWIESPGDGLGSTFFVELNIAK